MTPQILQEAPEEWTEVLAASETFRDDDTVEAGEILEEVTLIWVGDRGDGTVAYRVAASFTATDKGTRGPFTWQAVAVVPVDGHLLVADGASLGATGNTWDGDIATHVKRSDKESQAIREALTRMPSDSDGRAIKRSSSEPQKTSSSTGRTATRRSK